LYARGKHAAMKEAKAPKLLRAWRKAEGLTLEAAALLIVVDGKPATRATWFGWERGKLPAPPFLIELCRVVGLQPNDFYPCPDAGEVNALEPLAA
jgi:transcriptional regulator with XRE-family HTH domain